MGIQIYLYIYIYTYLGDFDIFCLFFLDIIGIQEQTYHSMGIESFEPRPLTPENLLSYDGTLDCTGVNLSNQTWLAGTPL